MVMQVIQPNPAEIAFGDLNNNMALDAGDLLVLMRVIQGQTTLP